MSLELPSTLQHDGFLACTVRSFIYWRELFGHSPTFIKVGAHDGVTGDPCGRALLRTRRWKGLLIEPVPYIFKALQANYQDQERFNCQMVAISSSRGVCTLYTLDPSAGEKLQNLPSWWDQLASFVPGHIEKHIESISPYIREQKVESWDLGSLIRQLQLPCPTLLHIDTEGHDLEVLKSYDFSIGQPRVLFIEIKHLSTQDLNALKGIISGNGYQFILSDSADIIAFQNNLLASICLAVGMVTAASIYATGRLKRILKRFARRPVTL